MTNEMIFQNSTQDQSMIAAETSRYEAETQAAMVIAKRFPRQVVAALERIKQSCTRPALAESGLYAYPRGGSMITGPSIRLAEAIAQQWGNLQFGIRELDQSQSASTVEAFAWDLETNTRQVKVFQVPHVRHTREGAKRLKDPRDIYEMVANQGARRLRACILGIIPGDIVEAAQQQCEETLQAEGQTTKEGIAKILEAFQKFGVDRGMIEGMLRHRIDSIMPAEMVRLRKIYMSLKDGMSAPADWFDTETKQPNKIEERLMAKPSVQQEWPREVDGILVDSRGIQWDERIHSAGKSVTHSGEWRRKRGVSGTLAADVEKELSSDEGEAKEAEEAVAEGNGAPEPTSEEVPLSEKWFLERINKAWNPEDLQEYSEVLDSCAQDMDPEVYEGLKGKIAHRRAEIEQDEQDS